MGWILIQPAGGIEYFNAAIHLKKTGKYHFDLTNNGARLKTITFDLRACNDNEVNFHSFTGEGAYGRWVITQNRKYL